MGFAFEVAVLGTSVCWIGKSAGCAGGGDGWLYRVEVSGGKGWASMGREVEHLEQGSRGARGARREEEEIQRSTLSMLFAKW